MHVQYKISLPQGRLAAYFYVLCSNTEETRTIQQMHNVYNSVTGYVITSNDLSLQFQVSVKWASVKSVYELCLKLPVTAGKKCPCSLVSVEVLIL